MSAILTQENHTCRYLTWLLDAFEPDRVSPLPVPPEFAVRESANGKATLRFYDIAIRDIGRLRFTDIRGGTTEIFSAMLFPHDATRLPIFASEFVIFGKLVRAAVIDMQMLGERSTALHAALTGLAQRYATLTATGPLPAWCESYFNPEAVFVLGGREDALDGLDAAYRDYAAQFAALACTHPSGDVLSGQTAMRAYKDHHIAHTPGLPYLERMFGIEWTARFLRDGMYA